jgi:rubrerythrin
MIEDTLNLAGMALRNGKVAMDLFPSAVSGFILQEGKQDCFDLPSPHAIHYDWTYGDRGSDEFMKLYQKAKKGQWVSEDLPWETTVDPYNPEIRFLPEKLIPLHGTKVWSKLNQKEKFAMEHSITSLMLSQFLHGEQGALYAAGMTVEATPWYGAKLYGATQVMDEGRHVEVFEKYLREKMERLYHVNDNLFVVIRALTASKDWDIKFLGMQIMIEGLALGAFGVLYKYTKEPLLKELLKRVISDESRHVHYGVEALRDYYTKEASDSVRKDREDWAYEVSVMLRNRFLFHEFHQEFLGSSFSKSEWEKLVLESDMMREFRRSLFSRLIPNLKAIGLLSDRIRPRYEALGVLQYEGEKAADELTLHDLLAA